MTCRIEMYRKPQPVPRSCSDCGLGPCKKGLKLTSTGDGYNITLPSGQVDTYNRKGECISSKGAKGEQDYAFGTEAETYLPERMGYTNDPPAQPVADKATMERINAHQVALAKAEAKREANPKAVGVGDRGLPSGDPLRGKLMVPGTGMFSIPVNKRLKLIGYLADNFDKRGNYTVHELDGIVDKIVAILLNE